MDNYKTREYTIKDRLVESELSKDPIYYVYEWFIPSTKQIFYVGKGKGNRYKSRRHKSNKYLNKLLAFIGNDVDFRIVKSDMTEYEAYLYEEYYMNFLVSQGETLVNVTGYGKGIGYQLDGWYYLDGTPTTWADRIERVYLKKERKNYDIVDLEKLRNTFILALDNTREFEHYYFTKSLTGYSEDKKKALYDSIMPPVLAYLNEQGAIIQLNKDDADSIIVVGNLTTDEFNSYKSEGKDIYHLNDVRKYIGLSHR